MHPSEWRREYEEIVELKRQMNLIDEAYEEMREWGTYMEEQNQTMIDTIKEDKSTMLELKIKSDHHREEYLKLVLLSNDLIEEIPRSLWAAEDMMDVFKPKEEICDFIKL